MSVPGHRRRAARGAAAAAASWRRGAALAVGLMLAAALPAVGAVGPRLVVVSGIGGAPEYAQRFRDWSLAMLDAAGARLGLPPERVLWLCEVPEQEGGRCAGPSRREGLLDLLEGLPPHEPLMLLLVGHGSARDGRALFNLPGPDLSAEALARALERFGATPVAVVNTAPASAPFVAALSAPGRMVVTATASAAENDHTRFAAHFTAAYAGAAADADKDGRVSLLEAFRFAARRVREEYEGKQQVATEHAMLEDNGDGRGSREPDPVSGDGAAAARFYLARAAVAGAGSPRVEALERQARAMVDQVALLRSRRAALPEAEYQRLLEALLVGLAWNRRALRGEVR